MFEKSYCLKRSVETTLVEDWRADLENGTGYDVTIIYYSRRINGRIGVGIDRLGFFIFKDMNALIAKDSHYYIAEKLTMPLVDAECMRDFFIRIFNAPSE